MTGAELASLFPRHGFDFFAGVPCSVISDVIAALGRNPAVLMQNSGLPSSS